VALQALHTWFAFVVQVSLAQLLMPVQLVHWRSVVALQAAS